MLESAKAFVSGCLFWPALADVIVDPYAPWTSDRSASDHIRPQDSLLECRLSPSRGTVVIHSDLVDDDVEHGKPATERSFDIRRVGTARE